MARFSIFIGVSLALHIIIFWILPNYTSTPDEKPEQLAIIEFEPMSKKDTTKEVAVKETPKATTPVVTPPVPEPKPEPKPEPVQEKKPESVKPVETPKPQEKPASVQEKPAEVKPETPKPEVAVQQKEVEIPLPTPTPAETPAVPTAAAESDEEEEEEIEEEPRDGKTDLPTVQTFVGDRIHGQIEFKGKGRKLVSIPPAPNFRLSSNTTVVLNFKIDQNGKTYDITLPPVSRDVEMMLTDFVSKMRFSAVLYNAPDEAEMKINLTVR